MGRLGGGGCPGETGGAEVVSHMDPALSSSCEAWRKSLSAASLSCVLCRTRAILVPGRWVRTGREKERDDASDCVIGFSSRAGLKKRISFK